jgi:hypothetical protein
MKLSILLAALSGMALSSTVSANELNHAFSCTGDAGRGATITFRTTRTGTGMGVQSIYRNADGVPVSPVRAYSVDRAIDTGESLTVKGVAMGTSFAGGGSLSYTLDISIDTAPAVGMLTFVTRTWDPAAARHRGSKRSIPVTCQIKRARFSSI